MGRASRLAVEKRVGGLRVENREIVGRVDDGRWSMADGAGPDKDGGMGGLKFAGGNLGR